MKNMMSATTKKFLFFIVFNFILQGMSASFCQIISDIRISPDGMNTAFVRMNDSLFLHNFKDQSQVFLTDSMNSNGNQRFLVWSKDGQELVYERESKIWRYNIDSKQSYLVLDVQEAGLFLFRFMYVLQNDLSSDHFLYFAADPMEDDSDNLGLFRINILQPELEHLFSDSLNVGNLNLSPDGKFLAFTTYRISGGWKTRMNVMSLENTHVVSSSELLAQSFFYNISWSNESNLILAKNVFGGQKIFQFSPDNSKLENIEQSWDANLSLIKFAGANSLVALEKSGRNKVYYEFELGNNKKREILSGDDITFAEIVKSKNKANQYVFTKENRISPISIIEIQNNNSLDEKSIQEYLLTTANKLSKYSFKQIDYTNGGDSRSSMYVYYPVGYDTLESNTYPLLVVAYGSFGNLYPDLQYFMYEKIFDYLDKGYFIAFLNTRGIGSEMQSEGYGKWQLQDTELAIAELKNQVRISDDKIFVIGHSHGAAMVYYYLTHSNLFAGGIAVNGAADWTKQAMLGGLMAGLPDGLGGAPDKYPELYMSESPIENIQSLKTPLLMFGGSKDVQIPAEINMLSFYEKAKLLDKKVKMILFDDEGHLIEKQANRIRFWNEIEQFLQH